MTHEKFSVVWNTERRDSYPDFPEPYTDEEMKQLFAQEPLPPNQPFQLPAEEKTITEEE